MTERVTNERVPSSSGGRVNSARSFLRVNLKIDADIQPELYGTLVAMNAKKRAAFVRRALDRVILGGTEYIKEESGIEAGAYLEDEITVSQGILEVTEIYSVPDSFQKDFRDFTAALDMD